MKCCSAKPTSRHVEPMSGAEDGYSRISEGNARDGEEGLTSQQGSQNEHFISISSQQQDIISHPTRSDAASKVQQDEDPIIVITCENAGASLSSQYSTAGAPPVDGAASDFSCTHRHEETRRPGLAHMRVQPLLWSGTPPPMHLYPHRTFPFLSVSDLRRRTTKERT